MIRRLAFAFVFALMVPALAGAQYINLGYCSSNIQYSVALDNGMPTKAAIAITRGMLGAYKNAEIVGVRVGLAASATNVSGWLIEGADPTRSNAATSPTYAAKDQGWQTLIFRSPYTFSESQADNAAIIIGYTSTGENQIGFDGETETSDNGNLMWCSTRGWGSVASACRKNGYGNACIEILLGGVELPTADMSLLKVLTPHAEQGKPVVLRGRVANKVPTPVTSFTLAYSTSGAKPQEVRITQNINGGEEAEFELTLPAFTTTGPQSVALDIVKVNDAEDENDADNHLDCTIESIEEGCYFPQVHVVEESTNLECGFCPRGIVVMESMEERHPGRFIGIAAHSDATSATDPLFVPGYYNRLGSLMADETMTISEPNGIMNRDESLKGDPLYWDSFFDQHEYDLAPAGLSIDEFTRMLPTDGMPKGCMHCKITTRFATDMESNPYRLAFILTEDEVGPYRQRNYYAGGTYGTMNGWENLPDYYRTTLNHIARGCWNFDGVEGLLPASVEKATDYYAEYSIGIDKFEYQKEDNLSLIALLIDSRTGKTVQATRQKFGASAEGVVPLINEVGTVGSTYDLTGRQLSTLNSQLSTVKGITIQGGRKVMR